MYNQLKNCTESRKRNTHDDFIRIDQRGMNTLCLEAKKQGINCWDRDVSRFVYSFQIPFYPSLIMPSWKRCWSKANDIGWTRKKKLPGKKSTNPFIGSLPKKMSSTATITNLFLGNPSRRIPQQKSTVGWNRKVRSQCATYPSNVWHKPYRPSV